MATAKTSDIEMAGTPICGGEKAIYGDKGYSRKALSRKLRARRPKPRIACRRHKTDPAPTPDRWKKNPTT